MSWQADSAVPLIWIDDETDTDTETEAGNESSGKITREILIETLPIDFGSVENDNDGENLANIQDQLANALSIFEERMAMEHEHEDGVTENAGEDSDEDNGKLHGDVNDEVNGETDDETDSDVDNLELTQKQLRVVLFTLKSVKAWNANIHKAQAELLQDSLDTARGH
ncbi:hypothetical protein BGX31_006122, partial [Mortierella sp. GBA43]